MRILKGEAPSAIQPAPPENRVAFDWRQLKRWGIDAQRLPPHSDVLFKTPSFWGMYHGYIIPTLLIIFLQSVLVFFLFKESLRRRRTQGHLTERLAFEEMLFDISARFVDLPPDQVDAQIAAALRTVGRHLRMDRITYFEFSETDQRLALLYSYVDPLAAPPPSEIGFERFDWARNKLQQREPISFADIGCLPPEAAAEKAYLEAQGIKSALLTPVAIGERTSGVLALGMVTRHHQWSGDMMQQCGIVARLIADAMSRKRFDEALLQSKNYTRLILDTLTSHIAVLDRQGVILDVNASWERFARENAAVSRAAVGPGANYLEICRSSAASGDALAATAVEGIQAVLAGTRQQFTLEYPCDAPAEKRWFLMKVIPFSGRNGRALVSHIDITGQKAAEIDLRKAYKDIEHLKNQLEAETSYLQEEIRLEHDHLGIVGQSAAIQYVLYKVEQVAATDTTVLVMGETGTGKELICRAIHSTSLRKGRPLVKVNCATLPANLIESELFGHERGAFSGAAGRRVGRFEIADRGTLFLDEIGEMPLELQAKLLRVLEEGAFERLGSSMTTKVDVRVIAATNRDLETQIREGGFREDLYYRLGTFPITVPPLRARREDIPLLTRHFVDQAARRLGKTIRFISEKMMTELQEYPWPGNVRELKNVVDRAVIHCAKPKLN
ncbi:MAG: sigma 54-interacting transcriptional regulator, partial [Desulfobacteraceae bacterium]|nr:sigma 54-interacting transcriptional regulator [Desulfobacteraceae bacterium]